MNISSDTTDESSAPYTLQDEEITYSKLLNVLHIAGLSILVYAMIALSALM